MGTYKDVALVWFLIGGLDGYYFFELDDFGGTLVDPAFFVGEEEVGGEDDPASECFWGYLRQDLRKRDCFSHSPYFWMVWIYFKISELSIN